MVRLMICNENSVLRRLGKKSGLWVLAMVVAVALVLGPGCGGEEDVTIPPPPKRKPAAAAAAEEDAAAQEAKAQEYVFVAEGLKDPFEPIEAVKKQGELGSTPDESKVPLTPLQKMDLTQVKLVAIIEAGDLSRALVEDSGGTGYIIEKGTPMGTRGGAVVAIQADKVEVMEQIRNYLGERKPVVTELKLHPTIEGEKK